MKILTDFHHRDLYHSLKLLFEDRLGFELYRPIGKEWSCKWMHSQMKQVPEPYFSDMFLTPGVGENPWHQRSFTSDGIYNSYNPFHECFYKGVSYRTFLDTRFDMVIPSNPANYCLWELMQKELQPDAVFVVHVGNLNIVEDFDYVIRSCPYHGVSKSEVLVHQEINQNFYKASPINPSTDTITSVQTANPFLNIWQKFKEQLPQYCWKSFGVTEDDGPLTGAKEVAQVISRSNMGWSTKKGGGLGHTNMGWAYSGRPVVTNYSEHVETGECAVKLFEPGVTCIDIDSGSVNEVSKTISKWMDPETGQKHGDIANKRFHEIVNYEEEAESVKTFLSKTL